MKGKNNPLAAACAKGERAPRPVELAAAAADLELLQRLCVQEDTLLRWCQQMAKSGTPARVQPASWIAAADELGRVGGGAGNGAAAASSSSSASSKTEAGGGAGATMGMGMGMGMDADDAGGDDAGAGAGAGADSEASGDGGGAIAGGAAAGTEIGVGGGGGGGVNHVGLRRYGWHDDDDDASMYSVIRGIDETTTREGSDGRAPA